MFPPPPAGQMDVPFGAPFGVAPQQNENAAATVWRQRQQQQRNLRVLMMFVMMLLLMEGEEQRMNEPYHYHKVKQSIKEQLLDKVLLDENLYEERKELDAEILDAVKGNNNYKELTTLNGNIELDKVLDRDLGKSKESSDEKEEDVMVYYYPWNSSGIYSGQWDRLTYESPLDSSISEKIRELIASNLTSNHDRIANLQMQQFQNYDDKVGVHVLEEDLIFDIENNTLVPSTLSKMKRNAIYNSEDEVNIESIEESIVTEYAKKASKINEDPILPKDGGRLAMQLFANYIPGMNGISFVDGFVKLYDGAGFATTNDVLLRVRGIAVHNIGKVSLLANAENGRSVLYVETEIGKKGFGEVEESDPKAFDDTINDFFQKFGMKEIFDKSSNEENRRRKLTEGLNQLNQLSSMSPLSPDYKSKEEAFLKKLRNEALGLEIFIQNRIGLIRSGWVKIFETPGYDTFFSTEIAPNLSSHSRSLRATDISSSFFQTAVEKDNFPHSRLHGYPYVPDDMEGTEEKSIGIIRKPSSREQLHQECEFEINLNTPSKNIDVFEYEKILSERIGKADVLAISKRKREKIKAALDSDSFSLDSLTPVLRRLKKDEKPSRDTLVEELSGEIVSHSCNFLANVTVTAIRIDWEETKGKAINYSFYMMLTCLCQIVILLRQLLHTQAQSAATRVSILCIGWQTVIDAMLCFTHVLFCLILTPLLPAFSSVAFFKLLIFGVIEMKYMTIILRARISSENPNSTTEFIRRRVTILQAQFYCVLLTVIIAYWYIGRHHLLVYVMVLYSFWVPQIIQNIITEAKRPLHKQYIYGMSLTRLMAPLYFFAVPNNFWQAANANFKGNMLLCELLVLWVGLQAAVLIAQGKYGARFMIPARFLPPKFDYGRPIPSYMLAALETNSISSASTNSNRINDIALNVTGEGTRNRINGSTCRNVSNPTTISEDPKNESTLDCVICCSPIDIYNRNKYMLAPCEHLFHRECLEQWMEVKMECPICRKNLPSL